jgi:catechol 2,3-dioxygenase-like lactoylglutathione lyase family enzyme
LLSWASSCRTTTAPPSAGPTAGRGTGSRRAEGRKTHRIGDVGFHHYAFELRNRKDVDALQAFLEKERVRIVDPAAEYYDDYYAVFFLDPDGLKLEGMKYGERLARKSLKKKG